MREIMLEMLKTTAEAAGFGDPKSPGEIIGAIVGTALSFLAIIFLCLILYGGFLWMTSGGNEIKVMKAKKVLVQSIVGVIIVLSAYSITFFVFSSMQTIAN